MAGGGGRKVFVYICKGVRRWAGAAGDLSPVDTVATGELEFFVPGLNLELLGRFWEREPCSNTLI